MIPEHFEILIIGGLQYHLLFFDLTEMDPRLLDIKQMCIIAKVRVIFLNQSISVSSPTQFFEKVSSKSMVKSCFVNFFLRCME